MYVLYIDKTCLLFILHVCQNALPIIYNCYSFQVKQAVRINQK